MKPTYTVRLTGPLDPEERARVSQRVAGTTDIDAQKIARLLERGEGRDLIKPSSANVANRLASVLAEAGAPVQLVPIAGEPVDAPAGRQRGAADVDGTGDEGLRPRQAGAAAPVDPDGAAPAGAGAEAAPPGGASDPGASDLAGSDRGAADPATAGAVGSDRIDRDGIDRDGIDRDRVDGDRVDGVGIERGAAGAPDEVHGTGARAAPPADASPAGAEATAAAPIEPDRAGREPATPDPAGNAEMVVGDEESVPPPAAEPTSRAPAPPEPAVPEAEPPAPEDPARDGPAGATPRRGPQPITQPQRSALARNGTAFLGAVGAAVLGIGAFLAMDFLLGPIAIGVLVLAALALVLSFAGQRRTVWLPGVGSIALLVWALLNAEGGAMASLAANWTWFAMFAGALLLIVAGLQSQRRRAA